MSHQLDWDTLLITRFYSTPNAKMGLVSFDYKKIHGCFPGEDGRKLLRTAKRGWMARMTVSRFICACLPRLASVLWRHDKTAAEKIIKTLQKSKIDTEEVTQELKTTRKERVLFDKSAKDYALGQKMYAIYRDGIEAANNSTAGAGIKIRMRRA